MEFNSRLIKIIDSLPPYQLPYFFISSIPEQNKKNLLKKRWLESSESRSILLQIKNQYIFSTHLTWDSKFFGCPFWRIEGMRLERNDTGKKLLNKFELQLRKRQAKYVFAIVPTEDEPTSENLKSRGWRLIESRVTYCHHDLVNFNPSRISKLRKADKKDSGILEEIAVNARNPLDRFHGDNFYSQKQVDDLMREWVRASISKGFADAVLVPEVSLSAFMTVRYLRDEWPLLNENISQMVLNAVHPGRAGWYPKLVAGSLVHLKEIGARKAFITTQAAHQAVIRTWDYCGLKKAGSSLVFRKTFLEKSS
jgi:hypothetical protein